MPTARKFLIPALAALAAAALAAGTPAQAGKTAGKTPEAAEKEAAPAKEKKKRSSCAFRRSINGFTVVDDKHLILESGVRHYFLATLSPGCHYLDFETAIAIKSTPAAGICVERGDRVILDDHYTCWIRDIEAVESKEEARKLVAGRTKPKDEAAGDAGKSEDKTEAGKPD